MPDNDRPRQHVRLTHPLPADVAGKAMQQLAKLGFELERTDQPGGES